MAYRQDKATTEKHARILRELVKQPGNKTCADCKRQDARWASWNIGVFICIRCSGIHRSMGTHISKVKSVDLDSWNPEQMDSIQKWGNHRANLYWEAHLRPGHIPPEHKVESFIRSKYESRRWARDGPPPADPSILESAEETLAQTNTSIPTEAPSPVPGGGLASPPTSPLVTSRQPQPHRLLSASIAGRPAAAQHVQAATAAAQQAKAPEPEPPKPASEPQNDLFSLDFHAPTPPASSQQQQQAAKKDVKNDILSLFSSSTPIPTAVPPANAAFGQFGASSASQWGGQPHPQATATQQTQSQPQSISMIGTTGTAMWGAQSGWAPPPAPVQPDVWGGFQTSPTPTTGTIGMVAPVVAQQNSTQSLFETQNVWGANPTTVGSSSTAAGMGMGMGMGAGAMANGMGKNDLFGGIGGAPTSNSNTQKKDDVFGDLWGDFK